MNYLTNRDHASTILMSRGWRPRREPSGVERYVNPVNSLELLLDWEGILTSPTNSDQGPKIMVTHKADYRATNGTFDLSEWGIIQALLKAADQD